MIAAYFFKCFLNYINLKKYAAMAAVFVLLLSRFGLSSKTLCVIKKSPEGLVLRKHGIPTLCTRSWITGTGTKLAMDDIDTPAI